MWLGSIMALNTLATLGGVEPSATGPADEVSIAPSDVAFVEAKWVETVVRARPWVPHRRVATVAKGTRFKVRGVVPSRDAEGCHGQIWYAVWPFGYICSEHVKPTETAPQPGTALPVQDGRRLPHTYAVVRYDGVPAYPSEEAVLSGLPDRTLTENMSLVVAHTIDIDGVSYVQTKDGMLVPRQDVGWMGQGSEWQGVMLRGTEPGPLFAWVQRTGAKVRSAADPQASVLGVVEGRRRVPLFERSGDYWRVSETGQGWMHADELNEVIVMAPPKGVLTEQRAERTGNDQWIDVDVGEQVLVAYRGNEPVYATLVSSGRSFPTPLGNYPIWAKVASMDMANQDYEDKPYMVQGVPWVLLFQGHNALHGAYWHDRFGVRKSHGCVNLAPRDARWVFEWAGPMLHSGWTGYLPTELGHSVIVHVRDSSRDDGITFTQERPWGPPDPEEERRKLELAAERRALAAAEAEALPSLDEGLEGGLAQPPAEPPAGVLPPRLTPPPAPPLVPPT